MKPKIAALLAEFADRDLEVAVVVAVGGGYNLVVMDEAANSFGLLTLTSGDDEQLRAGLQSLLRAISKA